MSIVDYYRINKSEHFIINTYNKGTFQYMYEKIRRIYDKLSIEDKSKIKLLIDPNVVKWILNDLKFLPQPENNIVGYAKNGNPKYEKTKKKILDELKKNEDKWCKSIMRNKRPDLPNTDGGQSKFGPLGEELCREYYTLKGIQYYNPIKYDGKSYTLDLETVNNMIESKAGSYYTTGTAGEKIMGVPYKYAEVPRLYNKPLLIICFGGSEEYCKKVELLGTSTIPEREVQIEYWKSINISYAGFSELLNNL